LLQVCYRNPDGTDGAEDFDAVVVATQACDALWLLKNPTPQQKSALAAFQYERSRVVVHTDPKLMPVRRCDWSPLNILVGSKESSQMPMCSVWMHGITEEWPEGG
jgi:predicted NAD/FAD-binding protein